MSDQLQQEVDLYSLSLDDLKKLAHEEANKQVGQAQEPEKKEQPRDEQGRFSKADEEHPEVEEQVEEEPEVEEVKPRKLYRRVVDIGEGVDPEVFEAESLEELVDKIAEAKKHATKKIREQEASLRKFKEAEAPKPRTFTEDEEYVFSQELLAKPTQAFAKMFKEMVGMEITEFKSVAEKTRALENAQMVNQVLTNFIATHPEYEDTKRNSDLMQLAMSGREFSAENLEKAYQSLVAKGLLDTKDGKASSVQEEPEQPKTGITSEGSVKTPPQGTKKASGLSTKNRPAVPVKSTTPSEDELYNMPLDKLQELANKQLSGR
jgi:predicted secreted protein